MTTLDQLRQARRELDQTVAEIRRLPGFATFLSAPEFAEVAQAADAAPIVYLVPAEPGGMALVVRGEDVAHVPLPSMSADAVRAAVLRFRDGYRGYVADPMLGYAAWVRALDETTARLWEVMAPILVELAGEPRATMIAGGLLGVLPLHAAWTPDETRPTGRRHALDELTITYAPNARSLTRAAGLSTTSPRLLTVADPSPEPLPFAAVEVAAAAAGFGAEDVCRLSAEESTPDRVVAELRTAGVALLSCHAYADLEQPLRSGLLLRPGDGTDARDGVLRLGRLLHERLDLRLAVLSACETSLPGTRLPDEVVALPTGLLQAGAAGVVASLWRVPDHATAALMVEFFRGWRFDRLTPPDALRAAQRWVRDRTTDEKIAVYERAADGDDPALPAAAGERLLDAYSVLDGDERSDRAIHRWAAFGYVGA